MSISTAYRARLQRATQIDPASIRPLGPDTFYVPSQSRAGGYTVRVVLDGAGRIATRACTCPAFSTGTEHPCQHILAAALKARASRYTEEPRVTPTATPSLTFTVSPFPQAGEPLWDDVAREWHMYDADGFSYWGDTPAACLTQYQEQMRRLAEHARKCGFTIEELRELWTRERDWHTQQRDERPY